MKTRYILSILAVTAMFAGCAKEQTPNADDDFVPELKENQFFATMEDGAKTILNREEGANYNKIFWESTDTVRINGSLFTVEPYGSDKRRAIFTLKEGQPAPSGLPYVAYYPSTIEAGSTLTLPSEITYNAENPFDGVFPMYAVSAGSRNLLFRNVCGLLEIKLSGTDIISSLTVSDASNPLSGTFTIDENHNAVILGGSASDGVTITCGEGVQLNLYNPAVFYVPVPKGRYTKLTVSAVLEGKGPWSADAKAEANVERNKVYTLNITAGSSQGLGGNNEEIFEINGIWQ